MASPTQSRAAISVRPRQDVFTYWDVTGGNERKRSLVSEFYDILMYRSAGRRRPPVSGSKRHCAGEPPTGARPEPAV